jgi:hypothetical protein
MAMAASRTMTTSILTIGTSGVSGQGASAV